MLRNTNREFDINNLILEKVVADSPCVLSCVRSGLGSSFYLLLPVLSISYHPVGGMFS